LGFGSWWSGEGEAAGGGAGRGRTVASVEVRRERDGTFRYRFKMGQQNVVSRDAYATEAEALAEGQLVRERAYSTVRPENPKPD
jgi:hypothetical protein